MLCPRWRQRCRRGGGGQEVLPRPGLRHDRRSGQPQQAVDGISRARHPLLQPQVQGEVPGRAGRIPAHARSGLRRGGGQAIGQIHAEARWSAHLFRLGRDHEKIRGEPGGLPRKGARAGPGAARLGGAMGVLLPPGGGFRSARRLPHLRHGAGAGTGGRAVGGRIGREGLHPPFHRRPGVHRAAAGAGHGADAGPAAARLGDGPHGRGRPAPAGHAGGALFRLAFLPACLGLDKIAQLQYVDTHRARRGRGLPVLRRRRAVSRHFPRGAEGRERRAAHLLRIRRRHHPAGAGGADSGDACAHEGGCGHSRVGRAGPGHRAPHPRGRHGRRCVGGRRGHR